MINIPVHENTLLQDHRRHPGCRLLLTCEACEWSHSYSPERVIDRLQQLRTSGHKARLTDVAQRVSWECPGCRERRWKAGFGWTENITANEVRRLTNMYRS